MITIKLNNELVERKTDRVYGALSNFVISLIEDQKADAVTIESNSENGKSYPVIKIKPRGDIGFDTSPEGEYIDKFQPQYEKYRRLAGENDSFIRNSNDLKKLIDGLKIEIRPFSSTDEEGVGGWMSNEGLMVLYDDFGGLKPLDQNIVQSRFERFYRKKDGTLNADKYHSERGELSYAKKIYGPKIAAEAQKIVDRIGTDEFKGKMAKIFAHELAHYINAIRSSEDRTTGVRWQTKRKDYRGKGGIKQFDVGTPEYARSTEELQARYSQVFHHIVKFLNMDFPELKKDLEDSEGFIDEELKNKYKGIIQNNINNIRDVVALHMIKSTMIQDKAKGLNSFMDKFKKMMSYSRYEQHQDRNMMKRVLTRGYELYKQVEEDQKAHTSNPDKFPIFKILKSIMIKEFTYPR